MSENVHQVQSLLDSVSNIIQKHETQANYTGENYNIFSIMGMETDEEFTHSRIIGNLLNPKGKHGCGDFFLKTFVEKLNILFEENNLHDMKLEDFGPLVNERITERYAGEVNCKTISGGSIDLVIEDSKQILLIENKIYAADQKYQLARYYNYAKTRGNKKIVMLYLTLDGKVILQKEDMVNNIPSSLSIDLQSIPKDEFICLYTPISYKTFIKEWLEACLIYVEDRPMIYYPIKHYYNLIKKLTNQSMKNEEQNQLINYIFDNNFIKEFTKLTELDSVFKEKLIIEYFKNIFSESYNFIPNDFLKVDCVYKEDCVYYIREFEFKGDKIKLFIWIEKIDSIYIGLHSPEKSIHKKYSDYFKEFNYEGLEIINNLNLENDIWLCRYNNFFNKLSWNEISDIVYTKDYSKAINYNEKLIKKIEEKLKEIK